MTERRPALTTPPTERAREIATPVRAPRKHTGKAIGVEPEGSLIVLAFFINPARRQQLTHDSRVQDGAAAG